MTQQNNKIDGAAPGIAARICATAIRGYRRFISPLKPPVCRFTPTCSAYALEAFTVHGFWKGAWLALCRIAKCHPFYHGSLIDPVPPRKQK